MADEIRVFESLRQAARHCKISPSTMSTKLGIYGKVGIKGKRGPRRQILVSQVPLAVDKRLQALDTGLADLRFSLKRIEEMVIQLAAAMGVVLDTTDDESL